MRNVLWEVIHHDFGGERKAVRAAIFKRGLIARLNFSKRDSRAAFGQDWLYKRDRIVGGQKLQRKDAGNAIALGINFALRLYINEVTFTAPGKTVDIQDGVERIFKRHVIQVHSHHATHFVAGHDVLASLDGNQFQELGNFNGLRAE